MMVVIDTDKLPKYYGRGGEIKVVDELNLEVYEEETFGLLGPNGAGKTTTVRLLNCIIKPASGTCITRLWHSETGNRGETGYRLACGVAWAI